MHPAPVDSPPRPRDPRTARASAVLAALFGVLLVAVAVRWGPLMTLDRTLARTAHRWAVADPGPTHVNRVLTDWVWDPWTMRGLCAVAVLWVVWRHHAWRLGLWAAATCALGTLIQQGLKAAVDRARPVWPDPVDSAHYAAFPSGHAMTATVVCGLVLWLLHRFGARPFLWRTACALVAMSVVGVGLTRLWLGVHWPSDVLGGWLLGALTVTVAVTAYGRLAGPSHG
ncbi:phosphatase PAP2 family protein [Streptomyces antnestii]|uniref:Phosphatase PAP2 family protein n=1 Tax=Streptomyces antnestii TaxID=2494256 RepID=A0A3S2W757_9ACTN|nr:phosphatase PAP2 family protein [Streptomyces sp. San01]RVU15395.1 phosphatase PAP2 family protein [Streptomyces sp. San01]